MDKLPVTFLFNLPALLSVFFMWWYRYTRSKNWNQSRKSFFVTFVMTCLSTYIVTHLLIVHPILINYIGVPENRNMLYGLAILTNALQMLAFSAFYLYIRNTQMRLRWLDSEREKAQFQFHLLKNQMNPHFLFNALNVAASLPFEDAERTSQFIKHLGATYRYLLQTSDEQSVPLAKEFEFVNSYIYLEKVRFEDKLDVDMKFDESLMNRMVIPGSIQMLVENAIKHNAMTAESPLKVVVRCDLIGVTVINNIQQHSTEDSPGRGLNNLRQQYAIFGKDINISNDGSCFTVRLPFL
ncbi:MAG: histidine kinase [Bacteroidaceae bacterium]|nr:histidine kinase [Bacteroidaceae bacterium]